MVSVKKLLRYDSGIHGHNGHKLNYEASVVSVPRGCHSNMSNDGTSDSFPQTVHVIEAKPISDGVLIEVIADPLNHMGICILVMLS